MVGQFWSLYLVLSVYHKEQTFQTIIIQKKNNQMKTNKKTKSNCPCAPNYMGVQEKCMDSVLNDKKTSDIHPDPKITDLHQDTMDRHSAPSLG